MPQIMTTKELAKYLKLHEITICKYAAEGKIPAIRIGRVWRFDKEAIDKWISGSQKKWYMGNRRYNREADNDLHDISSALLMINQDERELLKALLAITLKSQSSREWIIKKLGSEYLKIGEKLLKVMRWSPLIPVKT